MNFTGKSRHLVTISEARICQRSCINFPKQNCGTLMDNKETQGQYIAYTQGISMQDNSKGTPEI